MNTPSGARKGVATKRMKYGANAFSTWGQQAKGVPKKRAPKKKLALVEVTLADGRKAKVPRQALRRSAA